MLKTSNASIPNFSVLSSLCRLHFILAVLLVIQILVYHAWQLLTPKAVLSRWVATALFFILVTTVWYLSKTKPQISAKMLIFSLIFADIGLASYSVYAQRGMAARAVALYVIPLIVASVLASRSALLMTAAISVAAYTTTALAYFILHFNEGYKVELYGEAGFYSGLIFLVALLLWEIVRPRETK